MEINKLLNYGILKLKEYKIEEPHLKCRLLLAYILKTNKEYLTINYNEEVSKEKIEEFNLNIEKLIKGYPLQYITNSQNFMGMSFWVDDSVLIPQPDTEILVEEAIQLLKNKENLEILDMCTGSGAIAISLAKNLNVKKIYAADISKDALKIAEKNAKTHNVEDKIIFIESNMFEKLPNVKYDLIISNPPYIEKEVIKTLSKEVQFEPNIALDGGIDGLDFYKTISQEACNYLKKDSYLCLEIGYNQKESVINLLKNSNKYTDICCKKDLAGNNRVISAKKL